MADSSPKCLLVHHSIRCLLFPPDTEMNAEVEPSVETEERLKAEAEIERLKLQQLAAAQEHER